MPKNQVQFQRGMSLHEFMGRYGTREQCEQALFGWRWPRGRQADHFQLMPGSVQFRRDSGQRGCAVQTVIHECDIDVHGQSRKVADEQVDGRAALHCHELRLEDDRGPGQMGLIGEQCGEAYDLDPSRVGKKLVQDRCPQVTEALRALPCGLQRDLLADVTQEFEQSAFRYRDQDVRSPGWYGLKAEVVRHLGIEQAGDLVVGAKALDEPCGQTRRSFTP